MTRRQIADELGVHRNTVSSDLCTKNEVITEKVVHTPRKVIGYRITQYTKPKTAAIRIRDVFGDEWFGQFMPACEGDGDGRSAGL